MVEAVPEQIDFSKQEEQTLEIWKKLDSFKTSLELSKNRKRFILSFLYILLRNLMFLRSLSMTLRVLENSWISVVSLAVFFIY